MGDLDNVVRVYYDADTAHNALFTEVSLHIDVGCKHTRPHEMRFSVPVFTCPYFDYERLKNQFSRSALVRDYILDVAAGKEELRVGVNIVENYLTVNVGTLRIAGYDMDNRFIGPLSENTSYMRAKSIEKAVIDAVEMARSIKHPITGAPVCLCPACTEYWSGRDYVAVAAQPNKLGKVAEWIRKFAG